MPIDPMGGRPSMWSGGGMGSGFPQGPLAGPPTPAGLGGAAPPGLGGPMPAAAQGVPPMGARPLGPQGGPPMTPAGPPPLGGPPQGTPLGLTPEILAMIQARMAAKQFRPGPEDSLIPTGRGGGIADLRSGGY